MGVEVGDVVLPGDEITITLPEQPKKSKIFLGPRLRKQDEGKKLKLGVLTGGFVFNCSINLARRLRNNDCPLLESIRKHIQVPLEIVVGMNGRVWINARRERDIIAVGNAILAAEYKTDEEIDAMCDHVAALFTGVV